MDAVTLGLAKADAAQRYLPNTTGAARLLGTLKSGLSDANIVVLGDSTGASTTPGRWVELLTNQLAADWPAYTTIRHDWDNTSKTYLTSTTVRTGTGAQTLHVYNGSVSGSQTDYPIASYRDTLWSNIQPDVILVNYGHNDGTAVSSEITRWRMLILLDALSRACATASIIFMSQNPRTDAPTISALRAADYRELAQLRGFGFIDVQQAFADLGNQAVWSTYLLPDGLHPAAATDTGLNNGQDLWFRTVYRSFRYSPRLTPTPQTQSGVFTQARSFLANSDFADFWGGVLPGWTATNATLVPDTTNFENPANGYGVRIQSVAAAQTGIQQTIDARPFRGEWVTVAARMYVPSGQSATAGRVNLNDFQGSSKTVIAFQSSRGRFVWIPVTMRVSPLATTVQVTVWADTATVATADVTVDRVVFVRGQEVRDILPILPRDAGRLAAGTPTFSRDLITQTAVGIATGRVSLTYWTADRAETYTQVRTMTGTAASGTPTLQRVGIYSIDRAGNATLVASTPNDTTLWAATATAYTKALSAPLTTVPGQRYATGVCVLATSVPSFVGATPDNTALRAELGFPPRLAGQILSVSDLPSSFTDAGVTVAAQRIYSVLVP